jgi:hypothetical protein
MSRVRRDWRDTGRVAADLALLGLLVSAAALPVVTAGAAIAAGSAAVHHYLEYDRWPGPRFCWREFRRRLLPGLAAILACAAAAVLVVVDLKALKTGWVPGGPAMMAVTAVATVAVVGFLGVVVVAAGAGWESRVVRPVTVASMAGVLALAVVLAALVHPVLVPVLAGYTIFALHVVARRSGRYRNGPPPSRPGPDGSPAPFADTPDPLPRRESSHPAPVDSPPTAPPILTLTRNADLRES